MNNIFSELLKTGQKTMTNMITNNLGGGNNFNTSKEEKLRGQLLACTYSDDTKYIIEKAVKQVFHVYKNFDTDILSFSTLIFYKKEEANVQRRFLELKAILEIEIRGKICKVDYNMMIPADFPKKPPYVRIINRKPDFIVDDFYRPLQSPTDKMSYILNERLNEIKYWDSSKSIVNVIIESYDLLRNRFPFSINTGSSMMQKQPQNNQSPWSIFGSNQQPQQQGYNNQPNQQQGYGNMYNNNSGFQNYIQGGGFGNPFSNQGPTNQNYGFNNQNSKPPIPFNSNNVTQIIANGQKFSGESKKILEKLKADHTKALDTVQTLDTLRYSIQSEEAYLRRENVEMNSFLSANENNEPTESLINLVKPQDDLSEQILDLLSSIKAREDCTNELESKFNEGAITFDDFLKHFRKIEETKFEEKVLLAKCVSVSSKY